MDFFTADSHFGHRNIVKYCQRVEFMSPEERDKFNSFENHRLVRISEETVVSMNNAIIDNINAIVGPNDTLWHLGDFCFPSTKEKAKYYLDKINCKNVILVWGNHDKRNIASVFTRTYERYKLKIREDDLIIILSHYAQAVWDQSHYGAWHLYGHSHATAERWLDEHMPDRRSLDVGLDNAVRILGSYRPFSLNELSGIMLNRLGHSIDHHREDED